MAKGASFEREICKTLSLWWTKNARDDVFWRSSGSGGRATVRARKGQRTAGSYGDICALDPIGEPLLKHFTIELKRGRSHGDPGGMLDCKGCVGCNPWLRTLRQAFDSHDRAGSSSWMIICRRDFRRTTAFFPSWTIGVTGPLFPSRSKLIEPLMFRYRLCEADFVGMTLEKFLLSVDPATLGAP